ncbi:hypothetical protein E4T66_08815 [Sinimarinibacterium sp. CAU 1509]|uniref:DUF7931 domain-containing protein n=1 Tax=Sinimarinibacterium sp. CAU 1509 TaxID=2562283 RepID=UPI0010AD2768|nr:hypothetical protein [Sinimarinibacterium sp. CAU 1509]TJY62307.1 hypothetical protein E4T66_08815 [Sinimarinibacterium sp. CAU 1509]
MTESSESGSVIQGAAAFTEHSERLVRAARMRVCLFSQTLDARIYGGEGFADAVREFVLKHERTRVQVLIQQPEVTVRSANHLVELGRRLSSRIQFRQPSDEHRRIASEYLIGDERQVLYKERADQLDAVWQPEAPLEARLRLRDFDAIWEYAVPAQELGEFRL